MFAMPREGNGVAHFLTGLALSKVGYSSYVDCMPRFIGAFVKADWPRFDLNKRQPIFFPSCRPIKGFFLAEDKLRRFF